MSRQWTTADIPDLTYKIAIVTGANSGVGFETARELARKGARTILTCRDMPKGQAALSRIRQEIPTAALELVQLDLASLASIHAFAKAFKAKYDRLDILVNNAGILWAPYGRTEDGFERHLGTNYLGHFALTGLLIDMLLKTPAARLVTISSVEHYLGRLDFEDLMFSDGKGYNRQRAYRRSKLANLVFAYELERRLNAGGSSASSIPAHPGVIGSNMLDSVGYIRLMKPLIPLAKRVFQSPSKGALPILRAAVDPDAKGGQFYGPDGFLQVGGHPVIVPSSQASQNTADACRLWEISEKLTGISYL